MSDIDLDAIEARAKELTTHPSPRVTRLVCDIPALIARVREQEQEIAKLRENCAGYERLCRMLADAAQDAREARKVMARLFPDEYAEDADRA